MKTRLFVSTSVYALAHQLGMQGAINEVARQLDAPDEHSLPVVRALTRLRNLECELNLHVDGGATYIGQARSRAFHEARKSGLPWLTLDDDIEMTTDCAQSMLAALDDFMPRIVITPYFTRDPVDPRLTLALPVVRTERVRNGAKLLLLPPRHGGGFGFVGMNRAAIERIADDAKKHAELKWFDGGDPKLAIFYERLEDGLWYGEDTSFFRFRVPPDVSVEALLVGTVVHAGVPLCLDTL
jgi:hypothetical protein